MSFMDKARHKLQSEDPTERATTLWALAAGSDVPDDVLELIANLLDDRAPARMYVPFRYGEVRYIAAETYAKMLFHRGRKEPFILQDVVAPMKLERLYKIREQVADDPSCKGPLEWFAKLRDEGMLEIVDEVFDRQYFDMDE